MIKPSEIKKNNIKLNKTIFRSIKRLNSTIYFAYDYDRNAYLINIYTNEILLKMDDNRRVTVGTLKGDLMYTSEYTSEKNHEIYIVNRHCKSVFKYIGKIGCKPESELIDNNMVLIYLRLSKWDNHITNIVVYDSIQEKVLKIINNIVETRKDDNENLIISYYNNDSLVIKSIMKLIEEVKE